jgi:hypothetical protein
MKTILLLSSALCACTASQEASTVELPVTTTSAAIPGVVTDLGYAIELTRVRVGVTQIEFTIEGESHQKRGAVETTVPTRPVLHPGHASGGEVTGELAGDHVLTFDGQPQNPLGMAQLIVGDYTGANFAFRSTTANDGLAAGDPLLGHAFHLQGTATRDGITKNLDLVLDVEPDTAVIGAVFQDTVAAGSDHGLAIELYAADPVEGDTAFDGIDFFAISTTDLVEIRPGSDAHNLVRREIQTHDHYGVRPQ